MSDLECPYCGAENNVCNDDGAGYNEGELEQMKCCSCDKYFVFSTYIPRPTYEAYPAECLNGDSHNWVPRNRSPRMREIAQMHCKTCDESRAMTDKEWYEWIRQ